jgi:cyanophycinase-like exopeptidase
MHSSQTGSWLSALASPLVEKFGSDLTLSRTATTVYWGYGDQSAFIELLENGALLATFIDAPGVDAVSGAASAAVYRSHARYVLSASSCKRMIADLVDFFSGVREPRFTFVDAYPR